MKKNLKGFTLIELLVVIAVIGILVTIVLASLSPVTDKAKDTRAMAAMNQIRLEAHNYGMRQTNPGTYSNFCTQLTTAGTNARRLAEDIIDITPSTSLTCSVDTSDSIDFCVIALLNERTGTTNHRVCVDKNVVKTYTTTSVPTCTAARSCP